jgi:two-component system, chemotaxis family, CheB/CheR fusion protein
MALTMFYYGDRRGASFQCQIQMAEKPKKAGRVAKPQETAESPARAKSTPHIGSDGQGFPIVGVGASAGGLEALEELFSDMPADTGMAFVVVTHQHPGHTSLLPELLGKCTALEVVQATDGLKVNANRVYVGPPGGQLAIVDGVLHRVETTDKTEAPRLPIDYFFRSLASDQKDKAICIILSGTGTDGTLGLKAIKGESGMAMVQQAQSAKYAGMPSSALATGLADYVLPARDMAKQLVVYARGPYLAAAHPEETAPLDLPEPVEKIFGLLQRRTGHDFSLYKSSTIRRRIERRMNLYQIRGPLQYLRYLQENPHEIDILFKELLIGVTNFFRDPEAFNSLKKSALSELLKSRSDNYTFRFWVAGCASGEEVFSLAILMREAMEAAKTRFEVQIFGTDLDNAAIGAARSGQYPAGIAVDVSPQRLERFFIRDDSTYQVRKDIREMAIFAIQNVIKDPPFTKLDLISCRNLLIYLNAASQKRLLPVFHYALKPGGFLFLGPSETIGGFTDLFEVVDSKWKIFRRKETPFAAHPLIELTRPLGIHPEPQDKADVRRPRESNISSTVDRLLLKRFAPASVVVNDRGDIVHIHGRTGSYLEPAAGQPRLNVLDMAREGLQLELRTGLRQAVAQDREITREDVRVRINGDFIRVNIRIARINEPETVRGLFLITFFPPPVPVEVRKTKVRVPERKGAPRVEDLERELQFTKESLQSTIEELETSNEELKSTNEELQSTNEELQSTNEEAETAKEEMQSLNEELTTVNAEAQSKVDELSRANDDMQNLLNSIEIATLFLDNDLNIKRYTEQAKVLINLIQSDVGRPLGDLVSRLTYENLVTDCREVLRTLVFKTAEVRTVDGHWYLMRIMPYRTAQNVIDGLVITFVDINPVKAAERTLNRMSRAFLDALDPMIILDPSGQILDLNIEAARTYGWSRQELINQPVNQIVTAACQSELESKLRSCVAGEKVRNVDYVHVNKAGQELKGQMTLLLLTDASGRPDAICMLAKPANRKSRVKDIQSSNSGS